MNIKTANYNITVASLNSSPKNSETKERYLTLWTKSHHNEMQRKAIDSKCEAMPTGKMYRPIGKLYWPTDPINILDLTFMIIKNISCEDFNTDHLLTIITLSEQIIQKSINSTLIKKVLNGKASE